MEKQILDALKLLFPGCYLVVALTYDPADEGGGHEDEYFRYDPSGWNDGLKRYNDALKQDDLYSGSISIEIIGTDGGLNHKQIK